MKTKLLALLLTLSLATYGQGSLKGRVTDEKDQGLPGVNVLIKGTTQGTVTDANGEYTLANTTADAILVFSFIGYTAQEIAVAGKTVIDTQLVPDIQALQEVIVVGYGTTTAKELTGAVSVVKAEEITKLNTSRVDQALQGQVAGVQVTTGSGAPGGQMNIRIRGYTTNGDNNPLVVVDGILYPNPTDALNALNPSDIESVNVLKDGTAGIYGVQSANGVILITTKQGRKNTKPSLDFTGYYGVQEAANKISVLNATEFAVLKNETYAGGNEAPPYANVNLGEGTNWQNEVFGTAPVQNYNIGLTGGGEKATYSIGASYFNQEGIIGGEKAGYKRYNLRVNTTFDISPKFTLENVLLYTNERRSTVPEMGISAILFNTLNANPISSPYTSAGEFTLLEDVSEVANPLAQIYNTFNDSKVNKIVGKQELTYKINSHFELTGRAGYNAAIVDYKDFSPPVYYGTGKAMNTLNLNSATGELEPRMKEIATGVSLPTYNWVNEKRTTYLDYNFEAFLNFNQTFNAQHKVKGTFGMSAYGNVSQELSGTGYNVPYNSAKFADISAATGPDVLNTTDSWQDQTRQQSFFLRGEYAYGSKYMFSAIVRRDGSSRFGENNRFGIFPAASAAWVISEEQFFNSSLIEFMKVRASYGVSGNDKIENWKYRALLGGEGVYPFDDQLTTGAALGVPGNEDLKWETTHQTNFGIDLNLLNGKIDITTDYYIKKTNDLLFQPAISAISGAYGAGGNSPYVNGGDVKNSGFEFAITYRDKIGSDFTYSIGYNLTTIKNEVTALQQGVDFYSFGGFGVGGGSVSRMQVGYPIGYFFGYKTDGIYQTQQEIDERGVSQDPDRVKPGDLIYKDLDNSGDISFSDHSDKEMIGSPIPDVIMGMNLSAGFRGFDFSLLLYASIGNEIVRNYERQQPMSNLLTYNINRWTGPGSTNEYPRLTTGNDTNGNYNGVLSDYFVEDGSFLRIKNIQLGYTLPAAISKKIGARKLRFYVAANNLATFTKYLGYDPEFATKDPNVSGIDTGFYPQARTIMGGVNFNF
ncbi:MAG TPA: TonB-dependent receptor [Ohtaekwangia sp.]